MSTLVYVNLVRFSESHELEKGLRAVPFLWMQFVNSEFTFILVPCQLLPSKSQVAFCHFSRWESEHQISDIHQENPKIHPQIWRPPFHHRSTSSHFSHFRVSEIQNFSDDHFLIWCLLCLATTNQINWRPWTVIEGRWTFCLHWSFDAICIWAAHAQP